MPEQFANPVQSMPSPFNHGPQSRCRSEDYQYPRESCECFDAQGNGFTLRVVMAAGGIRSMRDRIIGALGVIWGGFVLVGGFMKRGSPEGVGASQIASMALAVLFIAVGIYFLLRPQAKASSGDAGEVPPR